MAELTEFLCLLPLAMARPTCDVKYFRFGEWHQVFILWGQWARIKHSVIFQSSSSVPFGCQTTKVFGKVHLNVALRAKSAIYEMSALFIVHSVTVNSFC